MNFNHFSKLEMIEHCHDLITTKCPSLEVTHLFPVVVKPKTTYFPTYSHYYFDLYCQSIKTNGSEHIALIDVLSNTYHQIENLTLKLALLEQFQPRLLANSYFIVLNDEISQRVLDFPHLERLNVMSLDSFSQVVDQWKDL